MSPTIPLSYRIPRRLSEALDAFCEAHPGITRSTAITLLLHAGLDQYGAAPPARSIVGIYGHYARKGEIAAATERIDIAKTDISDLLTAEG